MHIREEAEEAEEEGEEKQEVNGSLEFLPLFGKCTQLFSLPPIQ